MKRLKCSRIQKSFEEKEKHPNLVKSNKEMAISADRINHVFQHGRQIEQVDKLWYCLCFPYQCDYVLQILFGCAYERELVSESR